MVAWTADYLRVREREGRLYSDEFVRSLPDAPAGHPLAAEWRLRRDSTDRLIGHLRRRGARQIVDLGSGNGWLAAALVAVPGTTVVGVEANPVELEQARRVFGDRPNLRFVEGDFEAMPAVPELRLHAPDAIVLASVVQYVADLPALLRALRGQVAPAGQVHVLDSPLYAPAEVAAARERTRRHYEALGVPAMAAAYHHHTWDEVATFSPSVAYDPCALANRSAARLGRPRSPFAWLVFDGGSG